MSLDQLKPFANARYLNLETFRKSGAGVATPDAPAAAVLAYLMQEQGLKQSDLAGELGGQSIVSAILNGRREINTRQVKALARRFKDPVNRATYVEYRRSKNWRNGATRPGRIRAPPTA